MTHTEAKAPERWIGIDLNTTGYVAVVANPDTGFTAKLGREARIIHDNFSRERKKIRNRKKTKSLKKIDKREAGQLRDLNKDLSREIVRIASELECGIKFENIPGGRMRRKSKGKIIPDFSINNWYFSHLCQMVENRAVRQGITVLYVDPSYTSQICSLCGARGKRHRKVFQCPECGYIGHADVNAAFNIARSPVNNGIGERKKQEIERLKIKREIKEIKKIERAGPHKYAAKEEIENFPSESFGLLFGINSCEA